MSMTLIKPNETNMKKIGRTHLVEDTLWLVHSGSGAEFCFRGTKAVVTMLADSIVDSTEEEHARIAIYVNGICMVTDLMNEKEQSYVVLESDREEECTVTIIKLSEAPMSTVGIKSVETDSEKGIARTEDRARFIEFIGDSITCGYGVEDEDKEHHFKTSTENVTRAYAYKTAKELDADYSMVSFSGYGIISGYTATGETKITEQRVPDYYEMLAYSRGVYLDCKPMEFTWDFTKRQPDLIVVNLGTNDDSYTLDYPDRKEEYRMAYVGFLKKIRKNNPDAKILCTLGIMGGRLYPTLVKAVEDYKEETGDMAIDAMQFEEQKISDGYAADWHPTETTHRKAADKLIKKIQEIMGW